MNKTLTTACAALCLAMPALAATPTAKEFPSLAPQLTPEGATMTKAPARAPLNPTASLGTKFFASTSVDYSRVARFLTFWSEDVFNFNKLGTVLEPGTEDEDYPSLYIMLAGAYHNGEYYGYKVRTYSFGIIMPDSWLRVNTEDGTYEILREMYDDPGAVTWQQKEFTYDLASNPKDGYLYGLVQSDVTTADGNVTSKIVAIDDADGSHAWTVK